MFWNFTTKIRFSLAALALAGREGMNESRVVILLRGFSGLSPMHSLMFQMSSLLLSSWIHNLGRQNLLTCGVHLAASVGQR